MNKGKDPITRYLPCKWYHAAMPEKHPKRTIDDVRTRTEELFLVAYGDLNDEQRRAVDAIEGPVLVIAGPGTGKTQVLAMRTANILRKTQARPGNILCLTFSTAGVKAMRDRLRLLIGPDAYGIAVNTIHGFCNDVIQQYPGIFHDLSAGEQLSDIERLRLVRGILHALPVDSVLGRVTPGQDRSADVLARISQLRKENVSPADVRMSADAWEEELQTTKKTGKKRNPDSKAYKDDMRKVRQTREFADVHERYVAALREKHAYDYDDMILLVIQALRENDWMLAPLQERYQYVLVDEFQDLNGSQHALLETLTTYVNADQAPNIFVVGDDDQAIYRFQGASIQNMLAFTKKYPSAERIALTSNYRSTQAILDAATAVIDRNEERLSRIEHIDKDLVAAKGGKGVKPRFLRYADTSLERAGIVDILKKAHTDGTSWKSMAVLCRTNGNVTEIADVLAVAGIPAVVGAKQDLLAAPAVQRLVAVLRAVESPDTNASLGTALRVLGCHPADLGSAFLAYRDAGGLRREEGEKADSLRLFMHRHGDALAAPVREAFLCIEGLHHDKGAMTVTELVETAIRRAGLLPLPSATSADPRGLAALQSFFDVVKERALERTGATLEGLLSDLDEFLNEKTLTLQYDLPHLTSDGVELRTAHGAKGLEFDLVIASDVRDKHWGNRRKQVGVSLPDHLLFKTDVEDEKIADMEDERRLFFVAMTRARKDLVLTFPEVTRGGSELKDAVPSAFVADAGSTLAEAKAGDGLHPILTITGTTLDIDAAFRAYLLKRLESFELSVTALTAFLEDPQDFLWNHLLLMPRAKEVHLAYGSAVHSALEAQNLAWKDGEEFADRDLLAAFEKHLDAKELLTHREKDHYRRIGLIVLERYAARHPVPPIVYSAERTLKAVLPDPVDPLRPGIPLTGKVDRIDLFEIDGRRCRILDYKTGTPKRTVEAVRAEESLLYQLVFYKILADRSVGFAHEAVLFTFDFLGSDKDEPSTIDVEVTSDDVRALEDLIRRVWAKIGALDFTPLE